MIKSVCIALAIVFSFAAFAELTTVNGWAMASVYQRICILWSIGVLAALLYSKFQRGGHPVIKYSRRESGFFIRVFGYRINVIDRKKRPRPFSVQNGYVKEWRIGRYGIKFLRKEAE